MSSLPPLDTTDRVRGAYLRYLRTIYPFRRADLREAFHAATEEAEMLVKGPLLEASPPFVRGRSLNDLIAEGVLHEGFRLLNSPALPLLRPLHQHQERAIRHLARGRNLIVATGTGSGKTEAFLLPILDRLFREQAAGTLVQPGVRALLLYPMNALANDQVKRLRELLHHVPEITFGRYTGETQRNRARRAGALRLSVSRGNPRRRANCFPAKRCGKRPRTCC